MQPLSFSTNIAIQYDLNHFIDANLVLFLKQTNRIGMSKTTEKKQAKLCYEHIGGKLGSLLLERFIANGWLAKEATADKAFYITEKGVEGLTSLGIDLSQIKA